MDKNNRIGFIAYKVFIYTLGVFQAILYTPVVLSGVLFIVIIPLLFQNGFTNPLLKFFPNGNYETHEILVVYGKYAFGLSLVIAFTEMIFKKRFSISIKKKIVWLVLLLLAGYGLVLTFFLTKTEVGTFGILAVLIPFFIFSILAVYVSALLGALISYLSRIIDV